MAAYSACDIVNNLKRTLRNTVEGNKVTQHKHIAIACMLLLQIDAWYFLHSIATL